jgi:hypothetical protein
MTDLAAGVVAVEHRRAGLARRPPITPPHHDKQQVAQLPALVGEQVFVPDRPGGILTPGQDSLFDQPVQPLGEHLAGHAEAPLELLEAVRAGVDVPQDQRRPRLTDDVEGAGDRARHGAELRSLHDATIRKVVPSRN